jgi:cell division protein FtsW (lipid II flippase)
MIQLVTIALCAILINYFDIPMPDNQNQPEMFVIWVATRFFTVGLISSFAKGIFDSRDSEGYEIPWYLRPAKFIAYSAAVVACTFASQLIDIEWFSQWWGFVLYVVPIAAVMAVLLAGFAVFDSNDEIRGWY